MTHSVKKESTFRPGDAVIHPCLGFGCFLRHEMNGSVIVHFYDGARTEIVQGFLLKRCSETTRGVAASRVSAESNDMEKRLS